MGFSQCHARLTVPPLRLPPVDLSPFSVSVFALWRLFIAMLFFCLAHSSHPPSTGTQGGPQPRAASLSHSFLSLFLPLVPPHLHARADVWLSLYPPTPLPLIFSLASSAAVCLERGCILPSVGRHPFIMKQPHSSHFRTISFSHSSSCIASSKRSRGTRRLVRDCSASTPVIRLRAPLTVVAVAVDSMAALPLSLLLAALALLAAYWSSWYSEARIDPSPPH